jgi:hypothetical protein
MDAQETLQQMRQYLAMQNALGPQPLYPSIPQVGNVYPTPTGPAANAQVQGFAQGGLATPRYSQTGVPQGKWTADFIKQQMPSDIAQRQSQQLGISTDELYNAYAAWGNQTYPGLEPTKSFAENFWSPTYTTNWGGTYTPGVSGGPSPQTITNPSKAFSAIQGSLRSGGLEAAMFPAQPAQALSPQMPALAAQTNPYWGPGAQPLYAQVAAPTAQNVYPTPAGQAPNAQAALPTFNLMPQSYGYNAPSAPGYNTSFSLPPAPDQFSRSF